MRLKCIVLVPSFKPPCSSALFKSSFALRTSHHLDMSESNTPRRHHGIVCVDESNTEESHRIVSSSSTPIELFGGELSYPTLRKPRNHQSNISSLTTFSDTSVECPHIANIQDMKQKKRPLQTSSIATSTKHSPRIGDKRAKQSSWKDVGPPLTEIDASSTSVSLSRCHENAEIPLSIEGIEQFCRNVGASTEALDAFSGMCKSSAAFSFALLFLDGTTTHVETSLKFCVPSKPCTHWHCVCDRHIRARHGVSPLLGAAICIEGQAEHVYFLSLTNKLDSVINCATSIEQRWDVLLDLLSGSSPLSTDFSTVPSTNVPHKVLFNLQLAMHPLLHKMKVSQQQFVNTMNDNNNHMFDVKIASHLCDSNLSDEELEFRAISDRCRARAEFHSSPCSGSGMGSVTKVLHQLHQELQLLLQIHTTLESDLISKNLLACFHQIEMPISKQLSQMEFGGIQVIPPPKLEDMRRRLQQYVVSLERSANKLLAEEGFTKTFNLASPEQVAHILYSVLNLGLKNAKATNAPMAAAAQIKSGKHQSTSEEDLLKIKDHHPIVQIILSHRHVSKVLHTFIEGLQPFIAEVGEEHNSKCTHLPQRHQFSHRRVYATWNQTSTRTGRFSCQKPNLQAFPNPKRIHSLLEEDGVDTNVRAIFTASTGAVLISADYSQIEMRVLAHICGDQAMVDLFDRTEGDIYETLARIILNKKDVDVVSAIERERAKVICLGTMYGMGLPAAAAKLQISLPVAQSIVNSFYLKFKNVKQWIQFIKSDAKQKGYVATIAGRKRFLPDLTSSDTKKRSQAERQAVNSVIQGSASDVIKYAMLSVERLIDQHPIFGIVSQKNGDSHPLRGRAPLNPLRPTIISQIHDEVIYDIPLQNNRAGYADDLHVQEFVHLLKEGLENCTRRGLGLKVPLLVKIAIGENWGNMIPFSKDNTCTGASSSSASSCVSSDQLSPSLELASKPGDIKGGGNHNIGEEVCAQAFGSDNHRIPSRWSIGDICGDETTRREDASAHFDGRAILDQASVPEPCFLPPPHGISTLELVSKGDATPSVRMNVRRSID